MTFRVTYSVLEADLRELNLQFDAALEVVRREELGRDWPCHVAGRPSVGKERFEKRNPAEPSLLLARFHRATDGDLERAMHSAKAAQLGWAKLAWQARVACIKRAAEFISARRLRIAAWLSLEVGKTRLEALGDVEESADLLRYYAAQVEQANGFTQPLGKLSPNEDTRDVLRPYGVFAVISPFNFPMALAAGMAGAALLAGNAVILKPSEHAPMSAQFLFEVFSEAGLPESLFQVLHGDGAMGERLSKHPALDGLAFTGGSAVGRQLQHTMSSGRWLRPCLMELGGKNGALVCESADLEAAVEGCVRSAFGLSGQKCSALSRIFVARARLPEFLQRLVARTASMVVGDPTRADVFMGPVINARAVERFEAAVRSAPQVHFGGRRREGLFVDPTIVTAPRGHALTRDELFLPLVTVDGFDDFDEGLERLNEVDLGLTAGIFSADEGELSSFREGAMAGVLYANRKTGATTGAWPGVQSFTGWKASGSTGRGGCGPFYVSQFAREQSWTRMT